MAKVNSLPKEQTPEEAIENLLKLVKEMQEGVRDLAKATAEVGEMTKEARELFSAAQ